MEAKIIPLKEVLLIAFNFKLETDALVSLSQAVELVLKSPLETKPAVIRKLLERFGANQPHLSA